MATPVAFPAPPGSAPDPGIAENPGVMAKAISRQPPTRERLINAALELFNERGYAVTTVADIESAAGLAPRSGGLYKHFDSKEDLLRAALERHSQEFGELDSMVELMPLGDLRAELTLLMRWMLQQLSREEGLLRIVWREGYRFPDLVEALREQLITRGHLAARAWLRSKIEAGEFPDCDHEAFTAALLNSLAHHRVSELVFGSPPGGIDDERLIRIWVDIWIAFAGDAEQPPRPT
jgi:AcrR family transcriptional regulator